MKASRSLFVLALPGFWVFEALMSFVFADSFVESVDAKPQLLVDQVIIIDAKRETTGWYLRYYYLHGGKFVEMAYKRSTQKDAKEVKSSPSERRTMLKQWRDAGWTVEVKDQRLRKTTLYNFCTHPTPPTGKAFVGSPEPFEHIILATNPLPTVIPFGKIDKINVERSKLLTVKLLDGTTIVGPIAQIDYRGAQCGQRFDGYETYGASLPDRYFFNLDNVREMRFVHPKKAEVSPLVE